jgi:hypothetical protein
MIIISTVWEVITYDVWGNENDGYEVNQAFRSSKVEMPVKLEVYNPGIEGEFYDGSPDDTNIRKALGITPRVRFYDPYHNAGIIYPTHVSTDYPLGELRLISHDSLSFSPDKVITGKKQIRSKGEKIAFFTLANGDDLLASEITKGYAVPRRYLELDPDTF